MAERSPVPSPRIISEDRRNHAFRSLISDIAERLNDSDIQNIIWQQDVPSQNKVTALEVLEYLYKHGLYTEHEVRPLAQLLKDIHREDLTSRVDTFWKQFGRHYSSIDDSKRSHTERQFATRRRCTLSGGNPPLTIIMPPHPEIPSIVTTTEAAQESQESNAAALPDDHKYYLINSSPSTQSIVSEPPQASDQINPVSQKHHHSPSLKHKNKPFHTQSGSSICLHPTVSRVFSEPATKESLSASCSWLEVTPQRLSPQWCNSPPNPSSSNVSQVSEHNSDIVGPTAPHCIQHQSNVSPSATFLHHGGHFQRPSSLKSLPALMNDQHSTTSPPNGNCMTMHSHMCQGYSHAPYTRLSRGGHGHRPTYVSQCNPSLYAGMPRYSLMPEVVPQSSYSETDMLHFSVCNCTQNQCPHCGTSMAQHLRVPCHCIPVTYTESLDHLQTYPPNHHGHLPTMRSSSSAEISNSGTNRAPESSASGEGGLNLSIKKTSSAIQRIRNQNPAENDSKLEHWSSTNADDESNESMLSDENEGYHNKPTNSTKLLKPSKTEKNISKQIRPHSATTSSGNAATTTILKNNLHSSADTLAENHCTNSRTTCAPLSMLATKAKPSWKHVFFHQAKAKIKHPEPNQVIWPVKRDKLNKYIYKHTVKLKTCKEKLELVPDRDDCGPLPKFTLQLHPFGSEEDRNRCITAKVTIDYPKKCRLFSKTKIEFEISAREDNSSTGREIGHKRTQQEQVTQSFFYIKEFITHEELKESQCNYIYIIAEVKLV